MAVLNELLEANKRFAEGFEKGDLAMPPARQVAVLTCMDARLHPERFLGLHIGDAHVIRNAGGRASDDAVRSLIIGGHEYLDQVVRAGNIVITSNWDVVVERFAQLKNIPLRYSGNRETGLVLHKLHGSIDWCLGADRADYPDGDYAAIGEQVFSTRPYRLRVPKGASTIIRVRALESWSDAWRKIKSRTEEPFMVTMARGKSGDLGPLIGIWKDAYSALSRARTLKIVGYSMPPDDIEIRTLLRAGAQRGSGPSRIIVRNPAPDVHDRLRRYICIET